MALLPADPKGRKQAAMLMVCLIAAGWYVAKMYALDPRQSQVELAETALARLTRQNEGAKDIIARVDELNSQMEILERQLRLFEELIPTSDEVPELLDAITQEARSTGVELIRLRPQASQSGEFYSRQTWEVAVLGEYHDVGRYLGRVGSLPRIIKPRGLSVTPAPMGRATRDMDAPVDVSLSIETYVLGALPAAEPTEG